MFYLTKLPCRRTFHMIALAFLVCLTGSAYAFDASKYQSASSSQVDANTPESTSAAAQELFGAQEEPEFLQVDEAFLFTSEITEGGVNLYFDIADEYFLYLERFRFKALDEQVELGEASFSNTGKKKDDPYFGEVHVIYDQVEVFLPVDLKGQADSEIKVTYQGCADAGLCYPPEHKKVMFMASADSTGAAPGSNGTAPDTIGSGDQINAALSQTTDTSASMSFLGAALFALIGGLILNLMPCVFPVLSMKALSLVNMGHEGESQAKQHGLAYTAGVMISFVAIAATLIALKSFGMQIGWGFQLQNPLIVGFLAYLLFLIGLNLSGFFDISTSFSGMGQSLAEKEGASGSFFTGVLAAVVASPCVAPFMGAAIAYALTQGPAVSLSIFALLGLGLALPYLALCYFPRLRSMLPKPGTWMETFKEFLAFPMYGAAVWLVWVLSQQAGSQGILIVLLGMTIMTFGIWLRKHGSVRFRLPINLVAASMFVVAIGSLNFIQTSSQQGSQFAFTEAKLDEQLASTDHPIFVEMTAAWCISCKVNKRVALDTQVTQNLFDRYQVQHIVGDWTNQDANITAYLEKFNRVGVPLYVFYGARDESGARPAPVLLPQILTQDLVIEYVSNPPLGSTTAVTLR